MSGADPRSWFDRAIGLCLGILAGAAAIYIAVHLIEAVWASLLLILAVGALIAGAVVVLRARDRGW